MIVRSNSLLGRRQHRRGGVLLELVLTIPFSLALIFFAVDIGRYVLASAALHDAVAVSARAGARTGVVGYNPVGAGAEPCLAAAGDNQRVYRSFCYAAENLPGAKLTGFAILGPGKTAAQAAIRFCTADDLYVTVAAAADFEFLTDVAANAGDIVGLKIPGLGSLFSSTQNDLKGTIHATGTARCEVIR